MGNGGRGMTGVRPRTDLRQFWRDKSGKVIFSCATGSLFECFRHQRVSDDDVISLRGVLAPVDLRKILIRAGRYDQHFRFWTVLFELGNDRESFITVKAAIHLHDLFSLM